MTLDVGAELARAFGLLKQGDAAGAEAICAALAQAAPRDARPFALQARALASLGRTDDARAAVDAALALDPDFVPALLEDAQLARGAGDHARAVRALERLAALQPANAGVRYDLGVSLLALDRADDAARELERALAIAPQFVEARFKLGNLAAARGDDAAALAHYAACAALRPAWIEPWINQGLMLQALARPREAAQAFERALAIDPDHARALDGFARALRDAGGDLDRVVATYRRLCELQPGSAAAWFQLSNALHATDRYAERVAALERAIAAEPDFLPARWSLMQAPHTLAPAEADQQAFLARWTAGLAYFEQVDFDEPRHRAQVASVVSPETNFHLHYLGVPVTDLQRRYAKVVERLARATCPEVAGRAFAAPPPAERIRVAFVTGFLHRHTVVKLFRRFIEVLPRDRFEVTLVQLEDRQDAVTAELRAHAAHFFAGRHGSKRWIETLAARELDAVVYLDIGMHPVAQMLASFRFAPLQCVLWGHPVTTGFEHIDVFLTSDAMERDGGERDYAERVVRLPRLGTSYATPDVEPDAAFDIPARRDPGAVHYFVAQSVAKLGPRHDELFARIAAELPQARFSLVPHPREHVRAELAARMRPAFESRGLELERHVHFFPYLSEPQFMAVADSADVNLDSIGWSGGNTTLEITWRDVPTITMPLEPMRTRHTFAMLRAMGLDELVARDLDDTVRIAVELGRDRARRDALRARIRERKRVLYGDEGVAVAFREFLEREAAARR